MPHLPFRLGLGLCLTVTVVGPVRSADPPADGTDGGARAERSVTVEQDGRKVSITEDESGIRVTIAEDGKTTVVEADSPLELRAKSRRAHTLYRRHLRDGRSKVEANADGNSVDGAAGGVGANAVLPAVPGGAGQIVGPGQFAGPGQLAVGNGMTAGELLEATKAMAAGNRLTWTRGFGATGGYASGGSGTSVSFRDGDRRVMVSEGSATGITVAVTENGATNAVTARTVEELAQKSPEAFRLYQKSRKRARVSAGAGGRVSAGANGNGNSTASFDGAGFANANGGGTASATGGGSATGDGGASAMARRRILERRLRNARTEQERAVIARMLQQLGQ